MDSIKTWLQLMFILALLMAAVLLSFVLVPVLVVIGTVFLAWVLPKKVREAEELNNESNSSMTYYLDKAKENKD